MNHYKSISPRHKTRTIPLSLLSARGNTRHPINGRPNPVDMTKTHTSISPLSNLAINQPKPTTIHIHTVHPNWRVRWVKSHPMPKNHGLLINRPHRMNNSRLTTQPNCNNSKPTNLHYNNLHTIFILFIHSSATTTLSLSHT